jgi:hypothetical protein
VGHSIYCHSASVNTTWRAWSMNVTQGFHLLPSHEQLNWQEPFIRNCSSNGVWIFVFFASESRVNEFLMMKRSADSKYTNPILNNLLSISKFYAVLIAYILKVTVKLFLCLTNYALRHEGVWGSGRMNPHFLDLGTSWRWVVSFTPRPLYPHWIGYWVNPRAGLDDLEKITFFILLGLELRPLDHPARSQSLYQLRYPGSHIWNGGII